MPGEETEGPRTIAAIMEAGEDRVGGGGGPAKGQPIGSPGQKDDPELNARARSRFSKILQAKADQLTVAQRLTRRALKETIKIQFQDDIGPFDIEMRIPMSTELDDLLALRAQIDEAETAGDRQALEDASNALYIQLGNLATDPSINAGFFASGLLLSSDFARIVAELMIEEQRRVNQAANFRPGTGGR